jgi:hypothetical protein
VTRPSRAFRAACESVIVLPIVGLLATLDLGFERSYYSVPTQVQLTIATGPRDSSLLSTAARRLMSSPAPASEPGLSSRCECLRAYERCNIMNTNLLSSL